MELYAQPASTPTSSSAAVKAVPALWQARGSGAVQLLDQQRPTWAPQSVGGIGATQPYWRPQWRPGRTPRSSSVTAYAFSQPFNATPRLDAHSLTFNGGSEQHSACERKAAGHSPRSSARSSSPAVSARSARSARSSPPRGRTSDPDDDDKEELDTDSDAASTLRQPMNQHQALLTPPMPPHMASPHMPTPPRVPAARIPTPTPTAVPAERAYAPLHASCTPEHGCSGGAGSQGETAPSTTIAAPSEAPPHPGNITTTLEEHRDELVPPVPLLFVSHETWPAGQPPFASYASWHGRGWQGSGGQGSGGQGSGGRQGGGGQEGDETPAHTPRGEANSKGEARARHPLGDTPRGAGSMSARGYRPDPLTLAIAPATAPNSAANSVAPTPRFASFVGTPSTSAAALVAGGCGTTRSAASAAGRVRSPGSSWYGAAPHQAAGAKAAAALRRQRQSASEAAVRDGSLALTLQGSPAKVLLTPRTTAGATAGTTAGAAARAASAGTPRTALSATPRSTGGSSPRVAVTPRSQPASTPRSISNFSPRVGTPRMQACGNDFVRV